MRFLLLIPARNECRNLPAVLDAVRQARLGCEVLVVDDGSADGTAECARKFGAQVRSHSTAKGYSESIRTGYRYAMERGVDAVIQMDADGQHIPAEIRKLIRALGDKSTDVVLGSRFLTQPEYPLSRPARFGTVAARQIVSFFLGSPITDPLSGFRGLRREGASYLLARPCREMSASALIVLGKAGFRIAELPVVMRPRIHGRSMMAGWGTIRFLASMSRSLAESLPSGPLHSVTGTDTRRR